MAKINEYTKKDGSTAYEFSIYLGVDPRTGKEKRTTRRGFKTRKEAKLAIARIELGVDQPKTKTYPNRTTFLDVYKMWLPIYESKVQTSTLNVTKYYFDNYILPDLGNLPINSINLNDCQQAIIGWSKRTMKFKIIMYYAKKVFKYAIKLNIMEKDPFNDVEVPLKKSHTAKKSDNFYTNDELKAFLSWSLKNLSFSDFSAFRLLAYTGIRKGELRALKWSDLDFKRESLDINKAIKGNEELGSTKNTSSERVLSLDPMTVSILKKWKLEQRKEFLKLGITITKDQFIFSDEYNTSCMIRDHLRDMMKKYPGKKITIHGFRHTHATLLLEAGANYKDVQDRLGHSTAEMTINVYAHSVKNDDQLIRLLNTI